MTTLVNLGQQKKPKTTLKKRKASLERHGQYYYGLVEGPEKAPWQEDGYDIVVNMEPLSGWSWKKSQNLWGVAEAEKYDIASIIGDFYLLEAIMSGVFSDKGVYVPPFSGDKLLSMLKKGKTPSPDSEYYHNLYAFKLQTILVNHLSEFFRNYMHFVVAGEAAHVAFSMLVTGEGRNEEKFRYAWKKMVKKFGGATCADWAFRIFDQWNWSGTSYGGSNWAECAQVLYWFETNEITAKQFCDRVFSLQHCNGTILDRADWRGSLSTAENCLYAHGASEWETLKEVASKPVRELYKIVTGEKQKEINWKTWNKYPSQTYYSTFERYSDTMDW